MKFLGNPYGDLGISYHSSAEKQNDDGTITIRYVLSEKITPDQEKEVDQFENLKLVKNGCRSRYAPEQKYDVLYQQMTSEDEEAGFEDLDEYSIDTEEDNSMEILAKLENEISGPAVDQEKEVVRFSMLSHGVEMLNSLILYFKQVKLEIPELSTISDDIEASCTENIAKVQSLLEPNKSEESVTEEMDSSDDRMSHLKDLVIERIQNSSILSDEEKGDFISELQVNDLGEFMGFDEDPEKRKLSLSSEEEMAKAAEEYVSWYEKTVIGGEE